ncbi:MAG: transglutaminase domain-containing protein [Firmicutes bacterium]|nr:transglutaminase domain-containing protein [Bacillota bacterium]
MKTVRKTIRILLLVLVLFIQGCSSNSPQIPESPKETELSESFKETELSESSIQIPDEEIPRRNQGEPRERSEVLDAKIDPAAAVYFEGGYVDLSQRQKGFMGISYTSEDRLKFQVITDKDTYTYDLPSDGTETIFPFNMGDGTYTVRVMQNIEGSKYMMVWSEEIEVKLIDEFQPFLRPNQICNYRPNEELVDKAYELSKYAVNDLQIASAIYDYLKDTVTYDHDKAATVQSGYLPTPSSTLKTKDGICFDYAALAAAMLRSQGVPCQVVTGYFGEDELYHAWNRIYIKEQGWLSVEISVSANNWKRVDITFAAGNTSAEKLEDDSRYTNRYYY